MKWIEIEWNSERKKVPVQRLKGVLWFHVEGETHSVHLNSDRNKSSGSQAQATGELRSPMPGKILKIFKSKGDSVLAGQPILAMEAMKMEYTLEADQDGVLEILNVQVGDQVSLGQLLAQIKGAS